MSAPVYDLPDQPMSLLLQMWTGGWTYNPDNTTPTNLETQRVPKRKILITTNYYWPEDAGSAPYLTGLAEHLAECGDDVIVATTFEHYPEWRSSADGRLGATELRRGVHIRRRWTYVP